MKGIAIAVVSAALFTGCFTVYRSDYPEVQMSSAPKDVETRVQVVGLDATVTSYLPVYGHETVWHSSPGYWHRGHYRYGGLSSTTYSTTTYVPQTAQTKAYADRAKDAFEDAGFTVSDEGPEYRVEVRFSGPSVDSGDRTAQALWLLCSALSADYSAQTWTAKLRIYEAKTDRLAMAREYSQKYQAAVWGPIPILSPSAADDTDSSVAQAWCLSALTDRTVSDASAFLASRKK